MTRGNTLLADLDLFLQEICEDWEFSKKPDAEALLKAHPVLDSHHVARAILEADGMRPDREPSWMRRIKRRFAQRYRDVTISEKTFPDTL